LYCANPDSHALYEVPSAYSRFLSLIRHESPLSRNLNYDGIAILVDLVGAAPGPDFRAIELSEILKLSSYVVLVCIRARLLVVPIAAEKLGALAPEKTAPAGLKPK
jgi:hypothetical protein